MIAALHVESRGVYAGLPDVDLWDRDRDARTYAGPWPVVAHPPGARWGRSWGGHPTQQPRLVLGDDEGCFAAALDAMRRHGGVLEPPEASPAWTGLRTPHATESRRVVVTAWQGEWTCCVEKDTTGTAPARPQGGTQWAASCLAPANATQAAVKAWYSPKAAGFIGHENLRKPNIKAKLAESEAKALAKADLSAQHVLEVIRRHVMRDLSAYVQADGHLKPLHELTPDQIRLLDGVVRKPDGSATYRLNPPYKWVEMAAKHFSLLTERVELVDHRHIEDKLIEASERAVKAGHAKKHPDVGKAT